MHNPATGSQMAKAIDAISKSANPSIPRESSSSAKRSASPPRCEHDSHSSYHTRDTRHSDKRSHSWSCSHSRSPSCDSRDGDRCRQHSSHPHHDDYVGHHVFPTKSNPPDTLCDRKLKNYCHADGQIVTHWYRLHKNPSDFSTEEPCQSTLWTFRLLCSFWRCRSLYLEHKLGRESKPPCSFLTAMVNVKILSPQLKLLQLTLIMMTMTMIVTHTLVRNPPKLMTLSTSAIAWTPRPKTKVTGTTPNWMLNPQLGELITMSLHTIIKNFHSLTTNNKQKTKNYTKKILNIANS